MQIPGFNKKTAEVDDLLQGESIDSLVPSLKALPPLTVLPIANSTFLRTFYRIFYGLVTAALFIALAPYIGDGRSVIMWRLGWLCLLLSGCVCLWVIYRRQCVGIPVGYLAYENGSWIFSNEKGKVNYLLAGEVLCWSWLIILPLATEEGDKRFLLLAFDSLKPADQARLRTWLRACLKPKG